MNDSIRLSCLSCGQGNRVPVAKLAVGPKCAKCAEALVKGDVAEIDLRTHDKAVKSDELPLIVDYWAPWCGPCRTMAPEFAKAAQDLHLKIRFAKINTEQYSSVSQRLQIRGIPLLILYHKGRELGRLSGARPASDIIAFVGQHI